jgi:hypothetical protein
VIEQRAHFKKLRETMQQHIGKSYEKSDTWKWNFHLHLLILHFLFSECAGNPAAA